MVAALDNEDIWRKIARLEEELEAARVEALAVTTPRTVQDVIDAYCEDRQGELKSATVHTMQAHLKSLLGDALNRPVSAITPKRAAEIYEAYAAKVAADTHRKALRTAKQVWGWAAERGWVRPGIWDKIKPRGRLKAGKPQMRLSEARRFYAETTAQASEPMTLGTSESGRTKLNWRRMGALGVLCALILGLRRSEIIGACGRDLEDDFDHPGCGLWYVADSKTVNGVRTIQVPPELWGLLQPVAAQVGDKERVFPYGKSWVLSHVYRICDELGIGRYCAHSLRGLHASLATRVGSTAHEVAQTLGHGGTKVTDRHYISSEAKDKRVADERRAMLRVLKGGQDNWVKDSEDSLTQGAEASTRAPKKKVKSNS